MKNIDAGVRYGAYVVALSCMIATGYADESVPGARSSTSFEQSGSHRVGAALYSGSAWLSKRSALTAKPYIQRDYTQLYLSETTQGRRYISERVGNQARARYAAERGWKQLYGSRGRGIAQGPDAAYWDPGTGRVRVIESKGGASVPQYHYGARQGTNEYHIRAAWRVLRSGKATERELNGCARIIKAGQWQIMESVVTRGGMRGVPESPRLGGRWDRSSVRSEAIAIEKRVIRQHPELRVVFDNASRSLRGQVARYEFRKGLGVLTLAGTALLAWEAFDQSRAAWDIFQDGGLRQSALPYLQSAYGVGLWMQSGTLAVESASELGLLGHGAAHGLGRAAGKWFLPIAIATEACGAGVAYYKYSHGLISERAFHREMTGSGIFVTCTASGAMIGVWFGGVGALPGATIGAVVGSIAQGAASLYWHFAVDREFDEAQQQARQAAIYRHYGITH